MSGGNKMDIKKMHEKPPYGMIAILFIGAFVAFLNNTLLNIALPTIMDEFSCKAIASSMADDRIYARQWDLDSGKCILYPEIYESEIVYNSNDVIFSLGTLTCNDCTQRFGVLVAGRMIQASGSAMMMPLLMNVMLTAFPVERRGAAMGIFGLVMFTAPAIGPTLSGWVIEHYSWRVLFGIVLPIAILTLIYAIFKLRNITPNRNMKLDVFSLILSSIGFGGLLYGFSSAGDKGWDSPIVYGTIINWCHCTDRRLSFANLHMDDPMLDFKIYKHPMFALSSAISIVLSISMFSAMILTPLYVQTIRGISPIDAGILMLPGAVVMGLMSPITGRLFDKYGARAMAIIGLINYNYYDILL